MFKKTILHLIAIYAKSFTAKEIISILTPVARKNGGAFVEKILEAFREKFKA